jgi:hypothetical protein
MVGTSGARRIYSSLNHFYAVVAYILVLICGRMSELREVNIFRLFSHPLLSPSPSRSYLDF